MQLQCPTPKLYNGICGMASGISLPIISTFSYRYDNQHKIMSRQLWTATVDQWICCLNFLMIRCKVNFCCIVWFYHYFMWAWCSLDAVVYGLKITHVSDIYHVTNYAYMGITDQLFNLTFTSVFVSLQYVKFLRKYSLRVSGWLSEHSVCAVYEYSWIPQMFSHCKFSFMST